MIRPLKTNQKERQAELLNEFLREAKPLHGVRVIFNNLDAPEVFVDGVKKEIVFITNVFNLFFNAINKYFWCIEIIENHSDAM